LTQKIKSAFIYASGSNRERLIYKLESGQISVMTNFPTPYTWGYDDHRKLIISAFGTGYDENFNMLRKATFHQLVCFERWITEGNEIKMTRDRCEQSSRHSTVEYLRTSLANSQSYKFSGLEEATKWPACFTCSLLYKVRTTMLSLI